jgi:hypothetical protein
MVMQLLSGATGITTGAAFKYAIPSSVTGQHDLHIQSTLTGTGAVTASVLIQASTDPATMGWATIYQVDLTGTDSTSTINAIIAGAAAYRATVTAITGTGASVSVRAV